MSNAICTLGSCSVNAVAGDRIFIGQSTIGTSLFELETPYADPHVRCCERCDAKHPPTRLRMQSKTWKIRVFRSVCFVTGDFLS